MDDLRVDLWTSTDRAHPGGIIDLVPGSSGACVKDWITLQSNEFGTPENDCFGCPHSGADTVIKPAKRAW